MTRPYSPHGTTSTEGYGAQPPQPGHYDPDSSFRSRYRSSYGSSDYRSGLDGARDTSHDSGYEDYDAYVGDDHDDDSDDDDIYEYYEPVDRRWVWVASVAGVILLVAVVCTVVILGGGCRVSISTPRTSLVAMTPMRRRTTA